MSSIATTVPFAAERAAVAAIVDHTLLKTEATAAQVVALAAEAAQLGAHCICVSPNMLPVVLPDGAKRVRIWSVAAERLR
jgi:deoxyribose-phosphate aldolase